MFHTTLYINMIFPLSFHAKCILYNNNLHSVQSGGWICAVSVKTWTLRILFMWSEWVIGGLRAFCPGGLAKLRPVIRTLYRVDVHIGGGGGGGEGSCTRRLSFETMVHPSFCYMFLSTLLCIQCSHYSFLLYSHTSLVTYETFQTIMWMPRLSRHTINSYVQHGT